MDGPGKRKLSTKELMLLNCGVEKTLESPLDCKEIQPVNSKWNHPWIFIGRTDDEAETPILWPPDVKSWLVGKDPDAGKDWGQQKGMTEDEMAGWHHGLNGHDFEWTPWIGDGQGGLACCSPWGRKELNTTEQLNWTQLINKLVINKCPSHSMVKPVAWSSSVSLGFKDIVERLEIKSKRSADFWFHRSKYCSFCSYLLHSVPQTLCALSMF